MYKDTDTPFNHSEIKNFAHWCDDNHLILNVNKTEEMVFNPRTAGERNPVAIHNTQINQVWSYKHLGIHIDNMLMWQVPVESLMNLFYQAVLESLIRYGIQAQ